jgi:hypothetical protein
MSVYRFPECKDCVFHDEEPVICERCRNGSEFLDKHFELPPDELLQLYFETLDLVD